MTVPSLHIGGIRMVSPKSAGIFIRMDALLEFFLGNLVYFPFKTQDIVLGISIRLYVLNQISKGII